jgi:type III pantothenate kinase
MDKDETLLAIDVGNTHTVLGVFRGTQLVDSWRMATRMARTADEVWVLTEQFLALASIESRQITGMAISSVVPEMTTVYARISQRRLGLEPLIVSAKTVPWVKIHYKNPGQVGADRLCNAVAAFDKYGGPLIIIDFGTATTFDVVAENGDYLGGIIAPGLETAVASLHHQAAKLPKVDLVFPEALIGTTTERSIQSGVLFGAVEMVEGLVRRIREEMSGHFNVIATGGLASHVLSRSSLEVKIEPDLVLEGIRIIYNRWQKSPT